MVAYISAGPARPERKDLAKARLDAFSPGVVANVRDARMHASKKPCYTNPEALKRTRNPERLTLLGKLLYGLEGYLFGNGS